MKLGLIVCKNTS